jgi:hypothetical protein
MSSDPFRVPVDVFVILVANSGIVSIILFEFVYRWFCCGFFLNSRDHGIRNQSIQRQLPTFRENSQWINVSTDLEMAGGW